MHSFHIQLNVELLGRDLSSSVEFGEWTQQRMNKYSFLTEDTKTILNAFKKHYDSNDQKSE